MFGQNIGMYLLVSVQRHYSVDNLDPWAVHFYGNFGIRWYGLAYLAGFLLAGWILWRWARKGRLPFPEHEVSTFISYAAVGVIVGGRLGYCFLYEPHYVFHHPLEIFALWHGGMASHGGIAGMVIACWLYARDQHLRTLPLRPGRWAFSSDALPTSSTGNCGAGPRRCHGR